jgi:hypothetical protein
MEKVISEKVSKEKMLENILKEFSSQGELVKGLGDALMHITLAGHFNEDGEWQEPEWKNEVLQSIAQARELIQKLYINGLDYCNRDSFTELKSETVTAQVEQLYDK